MDNYVATKTKREAEWQTHLNSYKTTAKAIAGEWKKITQRHQDLQAKKKTLVEENGGGNVSDDDVLNINAGGQIVTVTRGTLTQVKGSCLEALFSGRWEKQLQKDAEGRIFLDVNATCFKSIVDYLNETKIAPPDNDPPDLPRVDAEHQVFLDGLLTAFGLHKTIPLESTILTDSSHVRTLMGYLTEDNLGTGLKLLYRGTRDGMNAASFHSKCDGRTHTLTVVRSTDNYIFGGFSDRSWVGNAQWQSSFKAFLFGLRCQGGNPVKLKQSGSGSGDAVYCNYSYGPAFGGGHDLCVMAGSPTSNYSNLGNTYTAPGGNEYYFTGNQYYQISEIEVFEVNPSGSTQACAASEHPEINDQLWESVSFDLLPEGIKKSFVEEKEALLAASSELFLLEESFKKEQVAVEVFGAADATDIALLNVSGQIMAMKHRTVQQYPDSLLYKHLVEAKANGDNKTPCPSQWNQQQVLAWSKNINGLSADVSHHFKDITGAELLALGREDIKDMGITRPGTVALIVKSIQKLQVEEAEGSAMLVQYSGYCVGKMVDHMRLKAMEKLQVPSPGPPTIREPDRKRFKTMVGHYFPTAELAAEFLP
jgi:TLD/BTB/POZ domain/SAM domain (Sterile alpha motif)